MSSAKTDDPTTTKNKDDDDKDVVKPPHIGPLIVIDGEKLSAIRVVLLGAGLVFFGMIGFYILPGLIHEEAGGSHAINSFYCAVMTLTTIGFGDICPAEPNFIGRIFLMVLPLLGLGFFCGPLLELSSSWKHQVPGGLITLMTVTIALGVLVFTFLEAFSYTDAIELCVITGTTIGYGNITPSSDMGRLALALYALLVVNVMGGFLDVSKGYLEDLCRPPPSSTTTTTDATTTTTKKSDDDKKKD